MYHLQTIKWISQYKISFGLSNLEPRFGINSVWHILIALLESKYLKLNVIYLLNYLPFIILINELFEKKKKNYLSELYLFLTLSFILLFGIIHPFLNGTILNFVGSPEVDTVAMFLFIVSIYLLINFFIDREKQEDYFHLLLVTSTLAYLTKVSHLGTFFFPLIAFIYLDKKIFFTKFNIIVILINLLWMIRGAFISACFLFPIKFTCFKIFNWSHIESVVYNSTLWASFSRDTRLRLKYTDFDHTINSYNWVIPWFKDYVLSTSLFAILLLTLFFSLILFFIKKNLNTKNLYTTKKLFFLIPVFIFIFFIWFKAPDVRFAYGPLITISTITLTVILNFTFFKDLFYKFNKKISFILLCLFFIKNISNYKDFFDYPDKYSKNYDHIKLIQKFQDFEIYAPIENSVCYDFGKICVNEISKKYSVQKKNDYLFFYRD